MKWDLRNKDICQKFSSDADEVEFDALRLGSCNIDAGLADEHMADAMDDFVPVGADADENPEWVGKDLANDTATGGVIGEIIRRRDFLGKSYPFEIDQNSLIPKDNGEYLTYLFCLVTSWQKNITAHPFALLPRTFELLVTEYAKFHLGPFGASIHTGWPRSIDSIESFKAMADKVHECSGEWWWCPQVGLEEADSMPLKDGGIDFIAWLESPDRRPGKLFLTGQCACGNDWSTKFNDASYKKYRLWFNPVSWIDPVMAFCTPYTLADAWLNKASQEAGIVYDRLRISLIAENHEFNLPGNLIEKMRASIKLVVES